MLRPLPIGPHVVKLYEECLEEHAGMALYYLDRANQPEVAGDPYNGPWTARHAWMHAAEAWHFASLLPPEAVACITHSPAWSASGITIPANDPEPLL